MGRTRDTEANHPRNRSPSALATVTHPQSALRVLSVFSGAGGLDLGLEAAGFRNVGCVELNPVARETLALNRPQWKLLEPNDVVPFAKNLCALRGRKPIWRVDLVTAGPPCQPFSKAAQWAPRARVGLKDPRASCIGALLDLIGALRPRALLIENVPGFVYGKTSALSFIDSGLDRVNTERGTRYRADYRVLDAADYGVPQTRRRALLVAFRDGSSLSWPKPTHEGRPVRAWDALRGVHVDGPPECSGSWSGLLPSIPEGRNYLFHTPGGGGESLFGSRTRYWSFLLKLSKSKPSWTLPAQPGPSTGPFHWDNRPLAPAEMQRLQTFPPSWQFAGTRWQQVEQIGNATPPFLAELIGRSIAAHLGHVSDSPPSLRIRRSPRVPRARRRTSVPDQYLRFRGTHAPHPGSGKGPAPRERASGAGPPSAR